MKAVQVVADFRSRCVAAVEQLHSDFEESGLTEELIEILELFKWAVRIVRIEFEYNVRQGADETVAAISMLESLESLCRKGNVSVVRSTRELAPASS